MTEESGSIRLSRRRVLGTLVTVGGAGAATGAGTMAYFSDSESSSGNTVQAGTLDLTLDGKSQTVTFDDIGNLVPGTDASRSLPIANEGSIEGELKIDVTDVRDYENGILNKESKYDSSTNQGELQKYLDVRIAVDGSSKTNWIGVDTISPTETFAPGIYIPGGDDITFTAEWLFNDPGNKTVNEAQSDSVEVDVTFRLVQRGSA